MKSNTCKKAKSECEILIKTVPDAIIKDFIPEILALVDKFGNSGQSGGSAPYTANAISQAVKKLCLQEPICDITGIDEEWGNITESGQSKDIEIYQNNRCSAIFKEVIHYCGGDETNCYYLDAIVFKGQNGSCFTGNSVELNDGSIIGSRQFIKEFPFKPKTFYIDVIETEWADKNETEKKQGGGWWTSVIKNENQLKPVFKYYNRFEKPDVRGQKK